MLSREVIKPGTFVTLKTACSLYRPVITVTTAISAIILVFVNGVIKRTNHIYIRSARARFLMDKVLQRTVKS